MLLKKWFLLVIILLLGCSSVFGEVLIRTGTFDFKPYYYKAEDGKIIGILPDILNVMEQNSDLRFSLTQYSPSKLYKKLSEGKLDVWPGIKGVPILKDTAIVGTSKITTVYVEAFWMERTKPVKNLKELAGKSILLIHGYSYAGIRQMLENPKLKTKVNNAYTHESALNMLQKGRCDYLLEYTSPINKVLAKIEPIKDLNRNVLKKIDVFFLVSKKYPNAQKLSQKINSVHSSCVKNGLIKDEY